MIYDNLVKNENNIFQVKNKVFIHFINGAFVEINGSNQADYDVKFINNDNNQLLFQSTIKNNMWTKCNFEYFINWRIEIFENGKPFYTHLFNASKKRVYIAFESRALGDTLSWVPYIEKFKKVHNCDVICSTFMNSLLESEYSDIEFVQPGTSVENIYAMYKIGLFYNEDNSINMFMNPNDPKHQTMQKMCSDILGLEYEEIRPKIKKPKIEKNKDFKQVCIGIHGTAQSKYWNNPNGWQEVVDWLRERGYIVKLISKEGDGYMGNKHPKGIVHHPPGPIEGVIEELLKSDAFIGIGSGLSWLSWGLEVPTVLISGFSYKWGEMKDCIRIGAPEGKCEGCFNRIRLDPGDWNWCPDHKGTERQFECTKSITGEMVIKELEKFL